MSSEKSNPLEPSEEKDGPDPEETGAPAGQDEETKVYYKRLEEVGRLADVDETTDLATLPPHVTHIRWPDGRIERIGYS